MVHGEAESGGWWTKALELGRGSRRLWIIAGLVGLMLGIAVALSLKPIVRHQARQAAQARGVLLAIGDVSIGWKRVTLSQVGVSLKDVDVVQSTLDRIVVNVGWNLKPESVQVVLGQVALHGTLDKIERQLSAWHAARGRASEGGAASGGGVDVSVVDLEVVWEQAGSRSTPTRVSGVSYARDELGQERVGWKTATIDYEDMLVSISDAKIVLGRNQGKRTLREVQAGDVSATLTLSAGQLGRAVNHEVAPAAPALQQG